MGRILKVAELDLINNNFLPVVVPVDEYIICLDIYAILVSMVVKVESKNHLAYPCEQCFDHVALQAPAVHL
jgi:hypothetical protein